MRGTVPVALVLTTFLGAASALAEPLHLEGDVSASDGAYTLVTFPVPEGTAELQIAHSDGSSAVILDWGVWSPAGFRGWGGGLTDDAIIGFDTSSRGYLPGAIPAGDWTLVIGEAQLVGGSGHYSVDVTLRTAPTLAPIPRAAFVPRVLASGARWYRGDFHVHSDESGSAPRAVGRRRAHRRHRQRPVVDRARGPGRRRGAGRHPPRHLP